MPGLSVTPTDMERMTVAGRAVASHAFDQFYYSDGVQNPSNLPECFHRGVDANTNWETQQRFKGKVKNYKTAKALQHADQSLAAAAAGKE